MPAIAELQSRPQWVAWKLEYRNGPDKKPTKPPVSPRSGFGASHSNPATWGTYQEAVQIAVRRKLPGVGYVISSDDDYTGIDLDDCIGPDGDLAPWAAEVIALAETYCEVSPSGNGLRLIARGKVDKTVKCDPAHVEIYRDNRYLTITGTHFEGTPTEIRKAPQTIAALLARVDELRPVAPDVFSPSINAVALPAKSGSSEFFSNVNTRALACLPLWVPIVLPAARFQASTGAFRVSSKDLNRDLEEDLSIAPDGIVDFGVHDMGDGRHGKRTAIDICIEYGGQRDAKEAAFWLCGKLGTTPENMGWLTGVDPVEASAAARRLIENHDGTMADAETGEIIEAIVSATAAAPPMNMGFPPGLVGDIAAWIVATARRPQPELALGAALTIVGTAAGRQFAGPTRSATHLYILGLAPTGTGKDHPLQSIPRILAAARLTQHLGPSEFISMPAVIKFLMRRPLSVCPMDEFGSFMKRINSKRASGFESSISKIIRTMWSSSFAPYATPEWAGKDSETIFSPSLSLYGASTPEQFYSAMEGASLEDGTLNRFLLLTGRERPDEVDPDLDPTAVPAAITDAIRAIYLASGEMAATYRNDAATDAAASGHVRVLPFCPDGSKERYKSFSAEVEVLMRASPDTGAFYARTAEMALRIATIVAVGRRDDDQVRISDLEFGIALATSSAQTMAAGAADYMADNENQANAQRVLRIVKARGGRVKHRDLLVAMKHTMKARDLKDLVAAMCDAGQLERFTIQTRDGPDATGYLVVP
ncbi:MULTISPECIES: DUF3987 domain-containing protein [unclassified Mesorhizobium]|uniref:DUF3987 domain-containing protein n=1 Tax=unclassified Mesorhizobium TaxID=325217 RepID=UPI001FF03967|nr:MULTISPECIES: DUF3987 domain-containing protein [unclassified Mesorhizobium]